MIPCKAYKPSLFTKNAGVCYGVKQPTETTCQGDKCKCTEYPDERAFAIQSENKDFMNFGQMLIEAQENPQNWYKYLNIYYNKNYGFVDDKLCRWQKIYTLGEVKNMTSWKKTEDPTTAKKMTKEEVLNKFNVQVID